MVSFDAPAASTISLIPVAWIPRRPNTSAAAFRIRAFVASGSNRSPALTGIVQPPPHPSLPSWTKMRTIGTIKLMWTAAGFEHVAEAFDRNFTERGELGAAFAAYHRGELVVDLWGGVADPETGRAWDRDTIHLMFSGTKGLTSACVLLLVQRGHLSLDDPLSRYWPEFGAEGKDRITIAEVLSHRARLPWVEAGYAD